MLYHSRIYKKFIAISGRRIFESYRYIHVHTRSRLYATEVIFCEETSK